METQSLTVFQEIALYEIIIGVIILICLLFFIIITVSLLNISSMLKNTNKVISAWSKETGIGFVYKCEKCKKTFTGMQAVCTHCGDPKTYK